MQVSGKVLAGILGLSPGRISQLKDEGILVARGSKYDLGEAVRGYISFIETGPLNAEVQAHRAKLLAEQTRRCRLENLQTEGSLIDVEEVRFVFASAMTAAVTVLAALPGRCAGTLAAMNDQSLIAAYLAGEVRQTRQAMSARFGELAVKAAKHDGRH